MTETNEKLEEKYKKRLEKDMNLFRKELIEDIFPEMEAYKIRLLNNYKNLEDEEKHEQEWKQIPLYKKIGIIARESGIILGIIGLGIGLFSLSFYLFNKNSPYNQKKEQTFEIRKPKEEYGIKVFYDRASELIKQGKQQTQEYLAIKDGIEYLLINESDDAEKIMGP